MLVTLALVVFSAAIITLFSQEFIGIYKKIIAIKGAKLILPLVIASWAVFYFSYEVLVGIYYYHDFLSTLINGLAWILPFGQFSSYIATILFITMLTVIPVILLDWFWRYRTYNAYQYPNLTAILIWLVSTLTVILVR